MARTRRPEGAPDCRRAFDFAGQRVTGTEDGIETDPKDDLEKLRAELRSLRAADERIQHLTSVLEYITDAGRCAVDQRGCGTLPQRICARIADCEPYAHARFEEADGTDSAPPFDVAAHDREIAAIAEYAGTVYGRLRVTLPAGCTSSPSERALLAQIARNLGFVLHTIAHPRHPDEIAKLTDESDNLFRDCFEGLSVGMAFVRGHDAPLVVNQALADFVGYPKKELEQIPTMDVLRLISHPEDLDREMDLLHDLMSRRRPSYTMEKRFLRKDGHVVPGLITTTFFFDGSGQFRFGVITIQDISERVRTKEELGRTYTGAIEALVAALESRDPYTAGHQRRVTQLACAIADEMGLTEEQRMGLRVASILHDIGKIAIPAEILTKPYGVTETERSLIRAHPTVAYEILEEIHFPWPVAEIVLQHHERLDGSGYPAGLAGDEILLEARILSVADVVEALASHRPYRAAISIDDVIIHIEEHRSSLFDPDVVAACTRVLQAGFAFQHDGPPPASELTLD